MLHFRFITRQIRSSSRQSLIFILCVALSLLILTSLGGFSSSVRRSMLKDARQLHAADIIVHSHHPLSPPLSKKIEQLKESGRIQGAMINEFYSMASFGDTEKSILSHLKVVERGYPFYGEVKLDSGNDFQETLTAGSIIVEQVFLDRLGASVGDAIKIGSASLAIADIVLQEPDRPVTFFSFGPRVFVSADDLDKLDLIKKGSRIHYNYLIKLLDPLELDSVAASLSEVAAGDGQERVRTYKNASSRVKRFFENLLFFLNLTGIFTLLLAGIGIQTSLRALLRESDYTIAIMKSVGATSRYITSHFMAMITVLGGIGTVLGLMLSYLLQCTFPILFAGILPAQVTLFIDWIAVIEGLALGAVVVLLFSYLPLQRIKRLKPAFIFRKELEMPHRDITYFATIGLITLFFTGLVIWQLEDVRIGLYFIFGVFGLIGLAALITQIFMILLRKHSPGNLVLRQAFRGLFRPGNATRSIIITLTASLSVIFSIYLVDQNLRATFIDSYPPHLPNAYFLDIQPDQRHDFATVIGQEATYYPVIRARLASINAKPIDREKERQRKRDNLAREFNLTYRDFLLEDEQILEGKTLFGDRIDELKQRGEVPMSILDRIADIGNIQVGDLLVFKVQGIPLKARVTSMRTRTESMVRPFFYFVFQEEVLQDAPHTIFSAARIERQKLTDIQNRLSAQLPNISVIDIGSTITILARIMGKMSTIVQFFTSFSTIAGLLIIISSILATKLTRTREAVYYKVLGAKSTFVTRIFAFENMIIALFCALMAAGISHVGSWIICRKIFDIPYKALPAATIIMIAATVLVVISVGLGSSISILRQKPVPFLREEEQE